MNYYVIIIKNDSQAINVYGSHEAAMSAFHSEMAYAFAANISVTCMVTDIYGSQIKNERYEARPEISVADEPINE